MQGGQWAVSRRVVDKACGRSSAVEAASACRVACRIAAVVTKRVLLRVRGRQCTSKSPCLAPACSAGSPSATPFIPAASTSSGNAHLVRSCTTSPSASVSQPLSASLLHYLTISLPHYLCVSSCLCASRSQSRTASLPLCFRRD